MIVALDFDGTVVAHAYPYIGRDIGAFPYLLEAQAEGAQFFLWTCRGGKEEEAAADYLKAHGIDLIEPGYIGEHEAKPFGKKAYANLYVDDRGLGVAVGKDGVVWDVMGPLLVSAVQRYAGKIG